LTVNLRNAAPATASSNQKRKQVGCADCKEAHQSYLMKRCNQSPLGVALEIEWSALHRSWVM